MDPYVIIGEDPSELHHSFIVSGKYYDVDKINLNGIHT